MNWVERIHIFWWCAFGKSEEKTTDIDLNLCLSKKVFSDSVCSKSALKKLWDCFFLKCIFQKCVFQKQIIQCQFKKMTLYVLYSKKSIFHILQDIYLWYFSVICISLISWPNFQLWRSKNSPKFTQLSHLPKLFEFRFFLRRRN